MKNNLFETNEEITEILKSHGLYQITLPLPFRLNQVNCFMAEGEKGWKIIDTWLHNKETVARWEQTIPQKEITDIIISHYHPDQYGYAVVLKNKLQTKRSMTKIDAEYLLNAMYEK